MIRATDLAELQFTYRVFYVSAAVSRSYFVACSPDGVATALTSDLIVISRFHVRKPIDIAVSSSGNRLAVVDEQAITVLEANGQSRVAVVDGRFQACAFVAADRYLCTTTRASDDSISLELRDSTSLQLLSRVSVDDPFGSSDCMIVRSPRPNHLSLWIAAGQDGQAIRTVVISQNSLTETPFTDLLETTPPAFSTSGTSVLVIHDACELRHYSYPAAGLLGTFHWAQSDDALSGNIAFLNEMTAIVSSENGRLYLIDLITYTLIDEVAIAGHEAREISKIYPSFHEEAGIASDLGLFQPLPDGRFVSTHRSSPFNATEWHDTLATWRLDKFGAA
jgi:hypothetical protein